jgi:hypothetical protein
VKIKHLLALLIIITNTLINSVWASVHLVAGDHDTLESPHLHVVPDLKTLLDFGQDIDDSTQGETEETHFHVLSDLTTQYSGSDTLKASLNINGAIPHYLTLTYSPPIQPPTQTS